MKKRSTACLVCSGIIIAGLFGCVSADAAVHKDSRPGELTNSTPITDSVAAAENEDSDTGNTVLAVQPEAPAPRTAVPQQQETPAPVSPDPAEFWVIKAGKTPDTAVKGSAFKSRFSATVTDERTQLPVSGISVTVTYPVASTDGVVSFEETELITDAQGTVFFSPAIPAFSCSSEVTFSAGSGNHTESVSVPYTVKTNLQRRGGTISILDYTKTGKPVRDNSLSASAVLTALMKNGFTGIGLVDFIDEINSGNAKSVYNAAHNLIGNASSFFIFGTVKYDGSVVKTDKGYDVPLVAEITCLDMRTGNHLYATEVRVTGTGKSEWAALNSARNDLLGPQLAERILYGM